MSLGVPATKAGWPFATPLVDKEITMTRMNRLVMLGVAALAATGVQAQDAQLARNLAATCANCHGTNGQARGDMKTLAGLSAEKIVALVADYRNGNQPASIMHQISKGYTDAQIRLIAGYFAAQPAKK
jgi:sulfide dehydrogenase cytochrome subunit